MVYNWGTCFVFVRLVFCPLKHIKIMFCARIFRFTANKGMYHIASKTLLDHVYGIPGSVISAIADMHMVETLGDLSCPMPCSYMQLAELLVHDRVNFPLPTQHVPSLTTHAWSIGDHTVKCWLSVA